MTAPLIAIPAYHLPPGQVTRWPTRSAYAVPEPYVEALRRAGARAAILPEPDDADPAEILERFDGLLLIGGGDVEPSRYGARPGTHVYGIEPDRDALEIGLVLAADRLGVPTLAICRGFQVVNVAFGGTLHQHLPDVHGLISHGVPGKGDAVTHEVAVEPETRLHATATSATLRCSSHHHQGADVLGDGLVVCARSADGLVEAVERADGWMLAVQWHPEDSARDDPAQQSLFDALGSRASAR